MVQEKVEASFFWLHSFSLFPLDCTHFILILSCHTCFTVTSHKKGQSPLRNCPFKVYSLVKSAVRVDCATVHTAALCEAAGDFMSHPLRLMMRLHAEEVVLQQLLDWQMKGAGRRCLWSPGSPPGSEPLGGVGGGLLCLHVKFQKKASAGRHALKCGELMTCLVDLN